MHGNVLVLEAATADGSVAVLNDDGAIAQFEFSSRDPLTDSRTEALAPAVARCLSDAGLGVHDLRAVVCDGGPGGFTSLRCAAALAKGLCHALGLPLYSVSSLELLAYGAPAGLPKFVVRLDAGRTEWFAAIAVRHDDSAIRVGAVQLVNECELRAVAAAANAPIVGPGCDVRIGLTATSLADHVDAILGRGAVSLDSWEPCYGRLAEAQIKWEAAHGRAMPV